ncbi:MAG: hypothetical protein ACPG5B_07020 [Chitinophagales bacterium]
MSEPLSNDKQTYHQIVVTGVVHSQEASMFKSLIKNVLMSELLL